MKKCDIRIGNDGTGDNINPMVKKHAREGRRGAEQYPHTLRRTQGKYVIQGMVDEGRAGDGHNVGLSEQAASSSG